MTQDTLQQIHDDLREELEQLLRDLEERGDSEYARLRLEEIVYDGCQEDG